MSRPRRLIRILVPILILAAGALVSLSLIWTAPQTKPEDKVRAARIVQTIPISPTDQPVMVTAYGPVIPARKVVMRPQVGGRVVAQHEVLVPGGYLEQGAELIRIDPADYELALTEEETALEQARFELEVEQGRQVVASREWNLLQKELGESEVNRALVLREPHLRRTEALLRRATNAIAKALLDLSRTSVTAPFNAMVLDESVEIGQLVEPGNQICTLVGTDEFWVQAALSVDKLSWIQLPTTEQPGATANVVMDTGNGSAKSWQGTVVRLLSDLETTGRMARVLVSVPDPFGLNSGQRSLPLLLDSYVRVDIAAGTLTNVLRIPRPALREGNRIWLVDANHQLQIRPADILWSEREHVLITNCLENGEQLVVSGLKAALPGMKVDPQPLAHPTPENSRENSEEAGL